MRSYDRLPIEEFGKILLETGDLDPLYLALSKVEWSDDQLKRWLVAYWCLYSAPLASYISEKPVEEFWRLLGEAAHNTTEVPELGCRWPRGAERRHWRGQQAIASYEALKARYTMPHAMVDYIAQGYTLPYTTIRSRVQEHRAFGPWISFKVGDMLDCLGLAKVDFTRADVFMFDDPRKSAIMLFKQRAKLPLDAKLKDEEGAIRQVVDYLIDHFKDYQAPPTFVRPVGLQEVETILCKWKSHCNGHYPIANDTREITHALQEWEQVSPAAKELLYFMPKER